MARKWKPKYGAYCPKCKWIGKRTKRIMKNPCPNCGYRVVDLDDLFKEPEFANRFRL